LYPKKWRFNSSWAPECADCSEFRDNRDPKDFERFCCRLLRHSGKRRHARDGGFVVPEARTSKN
jgi:hypothetical protein